jgi:tryptophanase
MLVNANFDQVIDFKTGLDLTNASVLVDNDEASPAGVTNVSGMTISGQTVSVEPLTAVLLKLK